MRRFLSAAAAASAQSVNKKKKKKMKHDGFLFDTENDRVGLLSEPSVNVTRLKFGARVLGEGGS